MKITVFRFVLEFNNFYNNVLSLLNEAHRNKNIQNVYILRVYALTIYDRITNLKNEIERTLESKVLSVEKASNILYNEMISLQKLVKYYAEDYYLKHNKESYEAFKFFNSIIDCYNEMCEEING